MAAPTIAGLAAQIAAPTDRIAALEGFVAANAALIAGLSESDEASGWKQWREQRTPET
jgi:hypothetical protein